MASCPEPFQSLSPFRRIGTLPFEAPFIAVLSILLTGVIDMRAPGPDGRREEDEWLQQQHSVIFVPPFSANVTQHIIEALSLTQISCLRLTEGCKGGDDLMNLHSALSGIVTVE